MRVKELFSGPNGGNTCASSKEFVENVANSHTAYFSTLKHHGDRLIIAFLGHRTLYVSFGFVYIDNMIHESRYLSFFPSFRRHSSERNLTLEEI